VSSLLVLRLLPPLDLLLSQSPLWPSLPSQLRSLSHLLHRLPPLRCPTTPHRRTASALLAPTTALLFASAATSLVSATVAAQSLKILLLAWPAPKVWSSPRQSVTSTSLAPTSTAASALLTCSKRLDVYHYQHKHFLYPLHRLEFGGYWDWVPTHRNVGLA
jgi:hypothetical protein